MDILSELKSFFKSNRDSIILVVLVFLLCLLAFGAGVLYQKSLEKPALEIDKVGE